MSADRSTESDDRVDLSSVSGADGITAVANPIAKVDIGAKTNYVSAATSQSAGLTQHVLDTSLLLRDCCQYDAHLIDLFWIE